MIRKTDKGLFSIKPNVLENAEKPKWNLISNHKKVKGGGALSIGLEFDRRAVTTKSGATGGRS
jgi:hypothetical protein